MIYKFAIIFSIIFILFVLNLVRRNKLDEKYSILWILFGVILLVVSLFPNFIEILAKAFNVYYPPALLLLFAIVVIIIYIIHITLVITKHNKMMVKLTQELAMLKEKMEDKD